MPEAVQTKSGRKSSIREQREICRICGSTDERPCMVQELLPSLTRQGYGEIRYIGPCEWMNDERTLCSNPRCLEEQRRREMRRCEPVS